MKLEKECLYCGKTIQKPREESRNAWVNRHKYCSRDCTNKSKIGKPSWNKGKHHSEETKKKLSEGHKKIGHRPKEIFYAAGKEHPSWKGLLTTYHAKHIWITKWKGKPLKCEVCGTTKAKRYHWANIDHLYSRNPDDYIRMCVMCHREYDRENN